jgi:Flp pilus assembly protein TadG
MTALARHLRKEQGAAAVEFALILPILVILVFGIIEFGRAYNAQVSLTGAAREGARHMAVTWDAAGVTAAKSKVVAAAALDSNVAVSISVGGAADAPCAPSKDATVEATYPLPYTIPLVGQGTWTVKGKAVMRCGG